MMHSPWTLGLLMAFFLLAGGGAYLSIRILGAHTVDSDHPDQRPH